VTSGFFGIYLPYDVVALGSVNAGVGSRSSCSFVLAGSSLVVALHLFLLLLLSSSSGLSVAFGDVTRGFFGISLP
jgi:hypothetical protein